MGGRGQELLWFKWGWGPGHFLRAYFPTQRWLRHLCSKSQGSEKRIPGLAEVSDWASGRREGGGRLAAFCCYLHKVTVRTNRKMYTGWGKGEFTVVHVENNTIINK